MLQRLQWDLILGSGHAISLLLAEMQDEDELFASPNTRAHVEAELLAAARTLAHLAPALRRRLVQVDWSGWQSLREALERGHRPRREAVWYGVRALMPATVHLLAEVRRRDPAGFEVGY